MNQRQIIYILIYVAFPNFTSTDIERNTTYIS